MYAVRLECRQSNRKSDNSFHTNCNRNQWRLVPPSFSPYTKYTCQMEHIRAFDGISLSAQASSPKTFRRISKRFARIRWQMRRHLRINLKLIWMQCRRGKHSKNSSNNCISPHTNRISFARTMLLLPLGMSLKRYGYTVCPAQCIASTGQWFSN